MAFKTLALLLLSITLASCYLIQGVIDNKGLRNLDYYNTKVVLNSGQYTGFVDNMGTFSMYAIIINPLDMSSTLAPTNQMLQTSSIISSQYLTSCLNIQVIVEVLHPENNDELNQRKNIKAFMYNLKSGKDFKLRYPLHLEPSVKIQYFEPEPKFNPMDWLKNPMVMMVGMTGFLMWMMKRMPKEEMQQMQDMQKDQMPQCMQQQQ